MLNHVPEQSVEGRTVVKGWRLLMLKLARMSVSEAEKDLRRAQEKVSDAHRLADEKQRQLAKVRQELADIEETSRALAELEET